NRMLAVLLAASDDYQRTNEALRKLGLDEQGKPTRSGRPDAATQKAQAVALARHAGLNQRREAARLFEDLYSRQKPTAEDQFLLVGVYESIGKPTKARTWMLRLLGGNDGNPRYVAHYAAVLLRQGDAAEAAPWVARLEKLAPRAWPTLGLKARLLVAQG